MDGEGGRENPFLKHIQHFNPISTGDLLELRGGS